MEKHLQEHELKHVHDKTKPSESKAVAVGIRKKLINSDIIEIRTDEGLETKEDGSEKIK